MRIIAGTHRGRRLLPPADQHTTRPITDRVKESLFDRLFSLGMLPPEPGVPAQVLDIFAGTGSLGLEALSRGATHCTFVEQDRSAVQRLRHNMDDLGVQDLSRVVTGNALLPMWVHALGEASIRLGFCDPPYRLMEDEASAARVMGLLETLWPKLEPGGVMVLRTPAETTVRELAPYDGPASFTYGKMTLHFYQRPMDEDEETAGDEDEGPGDAGAGL